jgi:hypothetical protein
VNGTGFNGTGYVSGYFDKSDVGGDAEATPCLDGTWCFGPNNLLCCQQNQGFTLDLTTGLAQQRLVSPDNATTITSTPPRTQSATPSSVLPTINSTPTSAVGGLTTIQAVGITLGAAGLLLVLITACWLVARRSRSKSVAAARAAGDKAVHYLPEHRTELQNDSRQRAELQSDSRQRLWPDYATHEATADKQQRLSEKVIDPVSHEIFSTPRHEIGASARHELA